MNPFPIINDKSHARIRVHTSFPHEGYKPGEFFVVQHGPDKSNLYIFEVLDIGPGGRATRTRMISQPLFYVSADGTSGLYDAEMAREVQDQPDVIVSGDAVFGLWIIRWLMDLALDHPGTIGGGFVDAAALREYRINADVLITHRESESVHQLQFVNGSFVRLFNMANYGEAFRLAAVGERFNFVGGFDVTDELWHGMILGRATREGPHAKWRIKKAENLAPVFTPRVRVCGVDCHKGDANCNGYCEGKAPRAKGFDE